MALVLADRVRDTTTTTSTGTVTLSGTAPTGYQTFATAIGNGNTTYYTINAGFQWEVGIGTYTTSGNTLTRTTVLSSSSGGALVDFAAGTKDVFVTYPAEKSVNYDGSNNVGIGTTAPNGKMEVSSSASGSVVTALTLSNPVGASVNTGVALYFNPNGAVSAARSASIQSVQSTAGNYADMRFFTAPGDTPLERMRIDSAGNVGIGTNAPTGTIGAGYTSRLTAYAAANAAIDVKDVNGNWLMGTTGGAFTLYSNTASAERMRISSAGLVGIGTNAPVSQLGVISAVGTDAARFSDNTNYTLAVRSGGAATALLTGTVGSAVAFGTNETEKMRITTAGLVGIGTTAPADILDIRNDTSGTQLRISTSDNGNIFYAGWATGASYIGAAGYNSPALGFQTAGSERMRITSAGNVGIGTSSPGARLEVSVTSNAAIAEVLRLSNPGSGANTQAQIKFVIAGTNYGTITGGYGAAAPQMTFNLPVAGNYVWQGASSEQMRLDSNGNLGVGATPSAWSPIFKAIQMQNGTCLASHPSVPVTYLNSNYYFDGSNDRYVVNGYASSYLVDGYQGGFTWRTAVTGTAGGVISFNERMRLDTSGNLGIGTSSPAAKLAVVDGAIVAGGVGDVLIGRNSSGFPTSGAGTGYFKLRTINDDAVSGGIAIDTLLSGTLNERMRITSAGHLLVGCTTTGFAGGTNTGIYLTNNTGGGGGIHIINNSNNTATNVVTFYGYNGSQTGSISTYVNTTNYNTSSDARLKENIADADDAASLIDAIKVRKFDWKLNNSHQRYGMVAQELVTVAPEAVSQQADPDDMMSVDYSKLVPMLIKALQELTARVAQLEGNQP